MGKEDGLIAVDQAPFMAKRRTVGRRAFLLSAAQLALPVAFPMRSIAPPRQPLLSLATWPTLPPFSANNFLDHFTGSRLDPSKWVGISGHTSPATSDGTIAVSDSYVDFNSAANQAAAMYYINKLDKTKSQLWQIAVSEQIAGQPSDFLWIVNSSTAPAPGAYGNIGAITRIRGSLDTTSPGGNGFQAVYFDGSHTLQGWNGGTSAWVAGGGSMESPTLAGSYVICGLEVDGPNSRFRLMGWGQSYGTAGTYTFNQGLRMFGLTDWVKWSSLEDTSNLWLVLGNVYNSNGLAGEYRVEWVRYGEALPGNGVVDAWVNQGATEARGDTGIRHHYSYDGLVFVPQDRTTTVVAPGSGGTSYDNWQQGEPSVATDGTTDYLFFDGNDSGVCVATAPHGNPQNGPWTKYSGNPVLGMPSGMNQMAMPIVFMDVSDPDPSRRWKMLYSAKSSADGFWRQRYATSPDPPTTSPWADQGLIIDVGSTGQPDARAARDGVAVRYGGQWEVWYEGWDSNGYTAVMRASGASLTNLTKDGAGARITYQANGNTSLSALFSGTTATVSSTAGFVQDGEIFVGPGLGFDTYLTSRVRKVTDATHLELYHGITTDNSWSGLIRVGQIDSGHHFTPRAIVQVGSEWWFYVNFWEPFLTYGGTSLASAARRALRLAPALAGGLVSYYKVDEGSGATVSDSVGANPGTWRGTLGGQWTNGIIGGAGSFNGADNYVDLGNLAAPPALSVSVWLDPGALSPRTDYMVLGKTAREYDLRIQAGAVENFQAIYAGSIVSDPGVDFAQAANQNHWYHYVLTADPAAQRLSLYRNGTLVASGALTTAVSGTATHTWIGRNAQWDFGTFRGRIDELGIWGRALAPAEVAQLYNNGSGLQYPFAPPPRR